MGRSACRGQTLSSPPITHSADRTEQDLEKARTPHFHYSNLFSMYRPTIDYRISQQENALNSLISPSDR